MFIKKVLPLLFILILLISPASAGDVLLKDVAGNEEIQIFQEGDSSVTGMLNFRYDYKVSGENVYSCHPDDFIGGVNIGFVVNRADGNQTIPFTLYYGDESREYEISITHYLLHCEITLSSEGEMINTRRFSHFFTGDYYVTISEYYVIIHSGALMPTSHIWDTIVSSDYDTTEGIRSSTNAVKEYLNKFAGSELFNYTEELTICPATGIKINLDSRTTNERTFVFLAVKDDSRYEDVPDFAESPGTSMFMKIYRVVNLVIPDPGNTLYDFFFMSGKMTDLCISLFTILIMTPFFYVFIAGVGALFSFVLNGSFRGGTSAAIRTFMWFMYLPFNLVKGIWHLLLKIIEVLYPF